MKPWGTRRSLSVTGRQGSSVTIVVEVYRRKIWLTVVDVPFVAEGILEPGQAESVAELLSQAAMEARGKQQADRTPETGTEAEDATGRENTTIDSTAVDP